MPRLLVVHHTPSPTCQQLLEAVLAGTNDDALTDVEVVTRPALTAGAADVLAADGFLLGTPANIGYVSGALKHFFDQVYYPVLDAAQGRPFGAWVHGNDDTTGAERAIETITTGLGWRRVAPTLSVVGTPDPDDLAACTELGGTVAATLLT